MNNNKPIHLLIDGDVTYHRATWQKTAEGNLPNYTQAVTAIEDHYRWLMDYLHADKMTVVLSGASSENFRKELYEPYKGDRPTERNPLLDELKAYLLATYDCKQIPMLEADDVLGILSSEPQDAETRIIVTIDKDLQQIPGFIFNPSKWKDGVKQVSLEDGDLKFYEQWMTGDSTDGYPGIPGVGPVRAKSIIEEARKLFVEYEELVPLNKLLEELILKLYYKHKLTYDYAVTQGRLARILRHGDYKDGNIRLWEPMR